MVVTAAYVFLGKAAEWWVTVEVDSMWWALPTVAACDGAFFLFRVEELPSEGVVLRCRGVVPSN